MFAKLDQNAIVKYPYSIDDLRNDNINTSFPENPAEDVLAEFNTVKVVPTAKPSVDEQTQYVIENTPQQIDGVWQQTWQIVQFTDEEITQLTEQMAYKVRQQRNTELSKCDWTQMPDVNLPNKNDWMLYRQQLRDISNQSGFPYTVVWPTAPQ